MYLWLIWFHIISMVSWFAVLFYMPRLFVYHQENAENEGFIEVIKVMEMKIYKYIGIPAFWATLLSGLYMLYLNPTIFSQGGWMHAKLTFVALLTIYFFSLGRFRIKLLNDECTKSGKFFRFYNEIPTILLMLIVAMVILRPF
jgi:putative membrane protein